MSMRIAVFSDIHGNPFATQAALDAISGSGAFDAVVMAGDVCTGGSDPAACVDMLQSADVKTVYGNVDEFIFAPTKEPPDERYRARWDRTVRTSLWAAEKLGDDRVYWLRNLPFELRFSPTVDAKDDLLIVHANPENTYIHILPPEEIQKKLGGLIYQSDDDPALNSFFNGIQAAVMAFGHYHYTSERYIREIRLVNVAPGSYSAFDPDRRTRYTVFTWDGEWQIDRFNVEYDYRQERLALLASDQPNPESMAKYFE